MIETKFHSPALLNTLGGVTTEEPKAWSVLTNNDEQHKAIFDLEVMSIFAEEEPQNYKFLKELFIKEEENLFFFEEVENAKKLDFPFAASMLGQLLSGQELIDALKRLDDHYNEMKHDDEPSDDTPNKDHDDEENTEKEI